MSPKIDADTAFRYANDVLDFIRDWTWESNEDGQNMSPEGEKLWDSMWDVREWIRLEMTYAPDEEEESQPEVDPDDD